MKPKGFIHLLCHLPSYLLLCSIQLQLLAISKILGSHANQESRKSDLRTSTQLKTLFGPPAHLLRLQRRLASRRAIRGDTWDMCRSSRESRDRLLCNRQYNNC
ncbi:hypothetical protein FVEG_07332 [Fusarium verticillioides 7600]|uniref:Secreted protein n=1 Tax=Gibberella moniliformis (strain M3125 / FGSC 7600) TaxID=334819 RepID=W7MHT6_GIBM7|nr:hypothetical protein FVEG_07332 [Fusarium verticillioides 7600]EWG47115.1 hypothetical protein FVEG_07332 [Fusarium verticillioides 7600]